MILCKLILFRINLEVHFNIIILKSEPLSFLLYLFLKLKPSLFLNLFQAPLAQDSRIA